MSKNRITVVAGQQLFTLVGVRGLTLLCSDRVSEIWLTIWLKLEKNLHNTWNRKLQSMQDMSPSIHYLNCYLGSLSCNADLCNPNEPHWLQIFKCFNFSRHSEMSAIPYTKCHWLDVFIHHNCYYHVITNVIVIGTVVVIVIIKFITSRGSWLLSPGHQSPYCQQYNGCWSLIFLSRGWVCVVCLCVCVCGGGGGGGGGGSPFFRELTKIFSRNLCIVGTRTKFQL